MSAPDSGPVLIGNRYRITACIGVGAMGAVWRATDELLGRTVAVKELLALTSDTAAPDSEQSYRRVLREARIGARLQHAHVISLYDVVIHEDRPWLVMEYLPAESLAARLSLHGRLQAAAVADIGRQMADGLAAAHLAGVVHRDVKPANVLVTANGLVKLTDFGISRAIDEVQLTRTGLIAGTPAYLAPEVAQGREPTAASDVFGLGATLYTAVEGVPPFGLGDNPYALLHKVATSEPAPPRQAGPLAGVLMRLLSIDPHARPSAAEARDLLAAVATGHDDGHDHDHDDDQGHDDGHDDGHENGCENAVEVLPTKSTPPRSETPRPPPVAGPARRRRAPALLGLLLGVLVLMGGAGILALTRGAGDVAAAPPTSRAATADPTSTAFTPAAASPPVTRALTATPSPTASASASSPRFPAPTSSLPQSPTAGPAAAPAPAAGQAASTDPVAFVQHYYALLPDNTGAAYALLGPRARSQAGGAVGFTSFYARMQSVTVQNPRLIGDNTVSGVVHFVQNNGINSYEPYRFIMTTDGTNMIMDSFSRV